MQLTGKSETILRFGRCQLLPHRGELLVDGVPVQMGRRALDVLLVLIEARGELVTKDEILSRVWPGRVVEENTLQVHVSALRKALGEDGNFLKTLSGRGYRFVADITTDAGKAEVVSESPAASSSPPVTRPPTNLPEAVSELISRDAEVGEVTDLAMAHRLITLTGAGGVGKTRLGFEVARQLLPKFADGVWVAELGPLSDPELVPVTVATALGLRLASVALSPETVASALGPKRVLLVLDNCEHVIEAATRMAEALLHANPVAWVLATSREPLRLPGEAVYRVPSLPVPAEGVEETEDLLAAGAVKLFMARARAAEPHLSRDQQAVATIAAICRRLDGIPLAIEFAAARAATLGVEGLAVRLDERFKLLAGGYRTALPRQQTLRATLDWSYELLSESERLVLCRLAVFAGGLTLDSASAVAASGEITPSHVIECLANLVAKSLLTADLRGPIAHYRLLDTTRAYAHEKLIERSELEPCARRHAEYYRDVFEGAEADSKTLPAAEWLAKYSRHIDNLRAALDWAFSSSGDATIGATLTVAAAPLWIHLSMMEECRARVERALAGLASSADRDARREMQLFAVLGASVNYAKSSLAESGAAWASALAIAQTLNDTEFQLRSLYGLWLFRLNSIGQCRSALALAERFCTVAASSADRGDALVGDRMMAGTLHFLGEQACARRHVDRVLDHYVTPSNRSNIIRFQFDVRVTGRQLLAQILWVQGFPDQAMRTTEGNVEDARVTNHALSLMNALEVACLVALFFVGDLSAAERYVTTLLELSERHAVTRWNAHCRYYQTVLLIKRGGLGTGLSQLRSALNQVGESGFVLRYTAFLGDLAEALGRTGEIARGLAVIDDALARCEAGDEQWCISELLRIKSELILLERAPNAEAAAERLLQQGVDWARRQGALSWELRCATSLARLWHKQRLTGQARELLGAVYGRFAEGFGTADLKAAKALLEAL